MDIIKQTFNINYKFLYLGIDGRILVYGGNDEGIDVKPILSTLEVVNENLKWKNIPLINHNYKTRYAHTAAIVGDCMIISFGMYLVFIVQSVVKDFTIFD